MITMHSCDTELLKSICPVCKTIHKLEFETEFTKEKFIPYLAGNCPKCNYKIFFEHNRMTSGTKLCKELKKGLESKI